MFTQALADQICDRLAKGESLRTISLDKQMPALATIFRWLNSDDHGDFRDQYARAREVQAETIFDQILDIADTPLLGKETVTKPDGAVETREGDMLGHRRLQIDARKWVAGKLAPKKYGEKSALELSGKDGAPLVQPVISVTIAPGPESPR